MQQSWFDVIKNEDLGPVRRLVLAGDTSAMTAPGQFADLRVEGSFLRRPISVCDWDDETLVLLFKVVGRGTDRLARMGVGERLDLLTGLGNGFDASVSGGTPLLVGGGVGIAPLYRLAKDLLAEGKRPSMVLGYPSVEEMFYMTDFRDLGVKLVVCTEDGSFGLRGLVTDGVRAAGGGSHVYACGPKPMLRALDPLIDGPAQYSFEERMGCGFGACMGCTVQTKNGHKRVCKDGPVFSREEVLW